MPEKSYVTMEQHVCPACAKRHDTGSIILHRRLEPVFDRYTTTEFGMCPECLDLRNRGYVAIVGIDPSRSSDHTPGGVWRTGRIAHIRKSAWIFDTPPPDHGVVFAGDDVMDILAGMADAAAGAGSGETSESDNGDQSGGGEPPAGGVGGEEGGG